jgi:hypothetical protein
VSVVLQGFDELVRALMDSPKEIRKQGFEIVKEETEGAAIEIAQAYPVQSGTLARRVQTLYPAEAALIGIVRSTAPHAHLYEFGTQARQTKNGAHRGRMPAHKGQSQKITPIIADRRRVRMVRRLSEMLERLGFVVEA